MSLPLRPLLDPSLDQCDLLGLELLARLARWHDLVFVVSGNALEQRTVTRLTGDDDHRLIRLAEEAFLRVEPQVGLALVLVGAVAGEAVFRQDRADVAIEV